ncbi:MAG: hypothetical protein QM698_04560 [Micropepsaceae bacterium]
MIITLAAIAVFLTLVIVLSLPFFGWGPGIDAAGRGMAMFFPVIAMTLRIACLAGAAIALATEGGLTWTGLSGGWAAALIVLMLAALGVASFITVSLLVEHAPPEGPAGPAWIAAVFTPLLIAGTLAAEAYVTGAQIWALRGLTAAFAAASFAGLAVAMHHQSRFAAALAQARAEAERIVAERAARLPADADLRATLSFLEALPEDDWQTRDIIRSRATSMPDRVEQTMAMLADDDRAVRLSAGRFATHITMPDEDAYYAIAAREIGEIIARLEQKAAGDAELYLEARAAIGLAWPAMHTTRLKQAQMAALHAALVAQGDSSACRALTHDVSLLRDYVTG